MGLSKYQKMRDFKRTPEPKGKKKSSPGELMFVVQKHDASHLHYDFRLEMEGVLKSWAVPKGPSLDPSVKRLAMQVEDHPYSYRDFEGHIPEGNYGAGDVIVWDTGTYRAEGAKTQKDSEAALLKGLEKGELKFVMEGNKLRGSFALVRTGRERQWLLIKHRDEFATEEDVTEQVESVLSDLVLERDEGATRERDFVRPMLATLTDGPFDRKDWIFEIKWDGYRAIAEVGKTVRLYSRNQQSFVGKYPELVEAFKKLKHSAVLDGEVVALDEEGRSRFQLLQNHARSVGARYAAFDLIELDGKDLRELPLVDRKKLLKKLIGKNKVIFYSDHVEGEGQAFFELAAKQGLEGVMAKDGRSPYREGIRSEEWLKIKTVQRQEVVIGGFTQPKGTRSYFGSLALGVYRDGELHFVGFAGTGFDQDRLGEIHALLEKRVQKKSPFVGRLPTVHGPVTWVKPDLLCEVKFSEWTSDERMRHPVFIGLREDKAPEEVKKEEVTKAPETHPGKIFWPKEGLTKGDLIDYYERIAPTILPYLKDRPESLKRHPNGIEGESFFQKNMTGKLPGYAKTHLVEDEKGREVNYLLCQNKETLLYMANLGCIELNPWNSRVGSLERPDYLILDLDPADIAFEELIRVAQTVHEVLEDACLDSYVKTSGKRGLHVLVPLGALYDYDQVKTFAELLMNVVHSKLPTITSIERSKEGREDKIYLDYLQNRFAQTLAAPYCVRPVPGACVSTPLKWEEVVPGLNPKDFTIKTIFPRLEKVGDLWKGLLNEKTDLKKALSCLQRHLK